MRPLLVTVILLALVALAVAGALAELVRGQRPALLRRPVGAIA
jgi:hypothetical protein